MRKFVVLIALLLPTSLLAGPATTASIEPGFPPELSPKLIKLRHEIAAAKLDRLLNVSRDQARALLPLFKEAQQLHQQLSADHEQHRPQLIAALTSVRDDIRKTGVVSDASKKALLEARNEAQFRDLHQKLRALHDKVRDILTPEQKTQLRQYDPRPLGRPNELGPDGFAEVDAGMGPPPGHKNDRGPRPEHGQGPRHRAALLISMTPEFQALLEARAQ